MSWLRLPPRAKTGEPVKAEHFNMLRDAVRAVALLPGVGYFLKRAAAGTTMEIRSVRKSQGTGAHPFKATANGDDTLHIGQGYAMNWGTSPTMPFAVDWIEFAGGDVTVTGTGDIYAVVNSSEVIDPSDPWFTANSITMVFSATGPPLTGDNIYFLVCATGLVDGVAIAGKQYLRQDITMPM